jgi:hypothetical protein
MNICNSGKLIENKLNRIKENEDKYIESKDPILETPVFRILLEIHLFFNPASVFVFLEILPNNNS